MPHVHSVHVTLLTVGVCDDEQRAQFFSMVSWLFCGERKDDTQQTFSMVSWLFCGERKDHVQQTEMNVHYMSEHITASVTENINKCKTR